MPRRTPKLDAALRDCGAVLLRERKHKIYQLPNGRRFTVAKSASDYYAEANALMVLRRLLHPSAGDR